MTIKLSLQISPDRVRHLGLQTNISQPKINISQQSIYKKVVNVSN